MRSGHCPMAVGHANADVCDAARWTRSSQRPRLASRFLGASVVSNPQERSPGGVKVQDPASNGDNGDLSGAPIGLPKSFFGQRSAHTAVGLSALQLAARDLRSQRVPRLKAGHFSLLRPDEPGLATGSTYEPVRVDVGVRALGVEPPDLVGGAQPGVVARHVPVKSLWERDVAYLQSRAAMEGVRVGACPRPVAGVDPSGFASVPFLERGPPIWMIKTRRVLGGVENVKGKNPWIGDAVTLAAGIPGIPIAEERLDVGHAAYQAEECLVADERLEADEVTSSCWSS